MKIVVLDGYAMNPGDLSWEGLKALGDVVIHDRTAPEDILSRSAGATALLTNKTPLNADTLKKLPDLKYIGVLATGYNIVDVAAAKAQGVVVTNIPDYSTTSVAQLVFMFMLEHCHHAQAHSDAVRSGRWAANPDFSFWDYPLIELAGKTLGIIGFGRIGMQVADIAAAFGMNVLGYSRRQTDQSARRNFRWASLDELLEQSDVISLHCPLTPETAGLINRDTIAKMKRTAFLINTSRGPVIAEQDLADALNAGRIAGAGVDVLSTEPPKADNPLLSAKNCLITPHFGWATYEARVRLMDIAVNNLKSFLGGTPVNTVG